MQQLIRIIKQYRNFLYFILLFSVGIMLTINNNNFQKSKLVSSTNFITGTVIDNNKIVSDYFGLESKNRELINENTNLRNKIALLESRDSINETTVTDTINHQKYSYINGRIRKNEFHKSTNYLTIDIGNKKGVLKEMGVINHKGIIGIVDDTSNNFARVQSILNINSKINARFKKNSYFGSLTWDGKDCNIVQLTDIPRQAIFKKGDTLITGGKSTIFPEGIPIGTIMNSYKSLNAPNTLNIKLFNDMSNLGAVYVIKSYDKIEVESLNIESDE